MELSNATLTADVDALLTMGRETDARSFVNAATDALLGGLNHDGVRLLLIRRLLECGLGRAATTFARGLSEEVRSQPEIDHLLRSLSALSDDGLVGWGRFQRQFDANLTALRVRYAWADDLAAVWAAERRHLELHVTNEGLYQVFDRHPERIGGWRPAFGVHEPQTPSEELAGRFKGQILPPLIIENVGLGYHLPWLHAATRGTFLKSAPVIYLVERSRLALAVALHLNDWQDALRDERVRLCCGDDAETQFEQMVINDPANQPPGSLYRALPWQPAAGGDRSLAQCMTLLQQRCEARRAALHAKVRGQYRGRDRQWWKRRYASALGGDGPPLRVLGLTCRFTTVLQYSMRDALAALRTQGCETRLMIEPNNHSRITATSMLSLLDEFEPDLVLIIDHLREGQASGMVDDVPMVTWIQDRLPALFRPEAGATIRPLDFFIGFGRDELCSQYGYPADRFMPCMMATDPRALLSHEHVTEIAGSEIDTDDCLACDVAYATTHSQTPEDMLAELREKAPQAKTLLDAAFDELKAMSDRNELNAGLDMEHFVGRIERSLNIELEPDSRTRVAFQLVRPLVDKLIRHQTIEWAARWAESRGRRFHLYGNGWEQHERFAQFARGFLKHGPELGRAFRAAKVNLHAGCTPAFHQRVLDGLSAGGFFMVRKSLEDITARAWPRVYEIIREKKLRVGDFVQTSDMPADLAAEWADFNRMRGVACDHPVEVAPIHFDHMRQIEETGVVFAPQGIWPDFDRTTFGTEQELAERLDYFVANETERREIAGAMRSRMLEFFTHEALMTKLLAWLKHSLEQG